MKTQYGDMPLIIDPVSGHAKMVRGGVERHARERAGPPSQRAAIGHRGRHKSDAGKPAPSPIDAYDSKLEAARATYLGYLLLAKDILKVIHHPFHIDIGEERAYTPDFLVWWADGRITVEEVKGSVRSKNARDSITRLHVATKLFPMFTWYLVMRPKGQWEEKCISTIVSRS